jgi:hypothetical protein
MVQIGAPQKGANIQLGDLISKAGIYTKPGVVVEKGEDGALTIDTDPEQIKKYHRHSNTTGLTPEEKEKFNGIMDEVISAQSNLDRINQLQTQIDTLKTEPANKKVVESLRNEQSQLIRIARELPTVYNFEADKIRSSGL